MIREVVLGVRDPSINLRGDR
ncbi:hypothetical protein E2C01_074696 [Portunus trituberculatus]|uniref:Uncharacterized protein n=1 Tax=Portunus trituberculatus TaxID=210409 RepID=A0A5B7IGY0_PORTR|nr:hypothetical protein [Portunus trituberculatus]